MLWILDALTATNSTTTPKSTSFNKCWFHTTLLGKPVAFLGPDGILAKHSTTQSQGLLTKTRPARSSRPGMVDELTIVGFKYLIQSSPQFGRCLDPHR
jgi:hypothetical protein